MAKQSLASLPMSALVKLRDRVGAIINRRTKALQKELRALGDDYKEVGRIAIYGRKKTKRRKATAPQGRKVGRPAAKSRGRRTAKKAVRGRKA